MTSKNGFSLIEVIISITIIGVIGVATSVIISRVFRTNSQNEDISKLKENGDRAVNFMAETIRSAEAVVCYGGANEQIVVRNRAGKYIKFKFVEASPPSGPITQNGYIFMQENLNPADTTQPANFCQLNLASPAPVDITNKNLITGVSIAQGTFVKLSGLVNRDTVTIRFYVNPTKSRGGIGFSQTALIRTTVQVR